MNRPDAYAAPPCEHPLPRTTDYGARVYCHACRRVLSEPDSWMVQRRWDALGPTLGDLFADAPTPGVRLGSRLRGAGR